MKCLLVTGRFDAHGGRQSKIGQIIASSLALHPQKFQEIKYINGGNSIRIPTIVREESLKFDIILWFPEVIDYGLGPKFVDHIKMVNPRCMLVTSKNNIGGEYHLADLVQRALRQKANLFIEIQKRDGQYIARVLDPLGNQFCMWDSRFGEITNCLLDRAIEIKSFTRIASIKLKTKRPTVLVEDEFLKLIQQVARRIGRHFERPSQPNDRFIGNASFRRGKTVLITKRNIDKEKISPSDFVTIANLEGCFYNYYGIHKPSIDSPIHLKLYELYPEANYILHGHAYLRDTVMTNTVIPCGALEEAQEIYKHGYKVPFGLNLKGHGFIALTNTIQQLRPMTWDLVARMFPEQV